MSKLNINIGSKANDKSGDTLRTAFDKINRNFTELYSAGGGGGTGFTIGTVDLHNGGVTTAQKLQFDDTGYQSVITGPTPNAGDSANRLIIQGQRASGQGEGGDVYVWGGDSQVNGGDIKIYAGDADSNSAGDGGYVNISAGYGHTNGGDITLHAGSSQTNPGNVNINTNGRNWTFDADGVLTLPDGQSIGSGSLDGIKMTTDRGTVLFGNSPECVPTLLTHFHIMKDDPANVDLFLGDDNNYVKLPGSGETAYGVEIGTNVGDGANTWRFGTDGALTLPAGGDILNSNGDSVLGGGSYTPDDSANWNDPTINTVQAALDELAARVTALQNFEIDGGNANTPELGELLIDGNGA